MANPVVGFCDCPLCGAGDAEVREGAKKALYIVCDGCVSQVRTMSRAGRAAMQARMRPIARVGGAPEAEQKTDKGDRGDWYAVAGGPPKPNAEAVAKKAQELADKPNPGEKKKGSYGWLGIDL